MYVVRFLLSTPDVQNGSFPYDDRIICADLDRALALASLLRKISVPDCCEYVSIVVEPFNFPVDEKK